MNTAFIILGIVVLGGLIGFYIGELMDGWDEWDD